MSDISWTGRFTRASLASMMIHGAMLTLLLVMLGSRDSSSLLSTLPQPSQKLVFLPQRGPGGGGGGNPAPSAPRPLQVAPHVEAAAVPVAPPEPTPVHDPPPVLNASVQTNSTDLMQASGTSSVALAGPGADGAGRGLGSGDGPGVGPGRKGGFGDGAQQPGNGISDPVPLRRQAPTYTPDAMRAKVQGEVTLEAVVSATGIVTDVRVTKSLDSMHGLDQEAMRAAKLWQFAPAKDRTGRPVAVLITMVIEFRLR